jgi:hypothetical protein
MKPLLRMIVACAVLGGVPLLAMADAADVTPPGATLRGWSIGAGLGVIEYREPGLSSTEPDFLYLQAGWRVNRYFMVEARLGTDAPGSGDSLAFSPPVPLRVQQLYGVYARADMPIGARCELFGLLGYTSIHWQSDVAIAALHGPTTTRSYATGLSWNFNRFSLDLELMPELVSGALWHSDALALGIRWQL